MHTFTVTVSEAQYKALAYTAVDPDEYVENFVTHAAQVAMDEIYADEVARMTADPDITTIPADKDSVVLAADVQSAAERQAAMEAELAAGNP